MILAILLIPALIAMAMLNSVPPARVATRLYIPCLMFFPVYLTVPLGGFLLTDVSLVILMLGAIGLLRWYYTLKFGFVDACIVAFALSAFYADAHQREMKIGMYALCENLAKCAFPYLVGRTLIEQTGSRKEFVKSLVLCLAIVGFLSLYEYRMQSNLFQIFVSKITGEPSLWGRQTRWGFQRVAGPYGHAIFAGMMFSVGLLLQLWLIGTKSWEGSKALRFFRTSRRAKVVTAAICIGLFTTQSRGPWIGCAFGLIIASIGLAKNRRRAASVAITGLVAALLVTTFAVDKYTSDQQYTYGAGGDQDQQNAAYRRNLIPTYMPLIAQGGIWGWGTPQIQFHGAWGYTTNQLSIDNEYILIAMAQGYLGLVLFVLILAVSMIRLARLCATFRNRQDIMFAYCMLGTLLSVAFTLTTVSLGEPVLQLAFMFLGWTQSLRPTGNEQESLAPVATGRFAFKRVFA